jgi:hypothetical protein
METCRAGLRIGVSRASKRFQDASAHRFSFSLATALHSICLALPFLPISCSKTPREMHHLDLSTFILSTNCRVRSRPVRMTFVSDCAFLRLDQPVDRLISYASYLVFISSRIRSICYKPGRPKTSETQWIKRKGIIREKDQSVGYRCHELPGQKQQSFFFFSKTGHNGGQAN